MIRIRSSTSTDAWWFDGYRFGDKPWHHDETPEVEHPDRLLGALVDKICGLARWGGERSPLTGCVWTVGRHSLLVRNIVDRFITLDDVVYHGGGPFHIHIPKESFPLLRRLAICHDFGEGLGIGDVAGPLLADESLSGLRVMARNHQLAAESLIDLPRDQLLLYPLRHVVHYADMLARVHERDVLWGDAEAYEQAFDEGGVLLRETRKMLPSSSAWIADLVGTDWLHVKNEIMSALKGPL